MAFRLIERTPGVSRVIAEYRRLLMAQHGTILAQEKRLAGHTLDAVSDRYSTLRLPDTTAGDGADLVRWRDQDVAAAFVIYLARAADFYAVVPAGHVCSLMEVGPGIGFSTLAHWSLNPDIRVIVNLDIPSTLYISTQYLKSTGAVDVVDYLNVRDQEQIVLEPGTERTRVYQLPSWCLDRLDGKIDWLHSAFAFQEMERVVAAAYLAGAKKLGCTGAWLMSSIEGHKPGAGGQATPVRFADLETALKPELRCSGDMAQSLSGCYASVHEASRLFARV